MRPCWLWHSWKPWSAPVPGNAWTWSEPDKKVPLMVQERFCAVCNKVQIRKAG